MIGSSRWGATRTARGHPTPYNVSTWYIGNEISQQARSPDYPASTKTDPPPTGEEYADLANVWLSSVVALATVVGPEVDCDEIRWGWGGAEALIQDGVDLIKPAGVTGVATSNPGVPRA